MIDFGITVVGGFTWDEIRDEFRQEFNRATNTKENGLHTYFFCHYHDSNMTAEIVYSIVDNSAVTFYLDSAQYQMTLDRKLQVTGFQINDGHAEIWMKALLEHEDVECIAEQCDEQGHLYQIFTINTEKMLKYVNDTYSGLYPIDMIVRIGEDPHPCIPMLITQNPQIHDDEIIDELCASFMSYVSKKYVKQIEEAILTDSADGIESNPFKDKFFDRDESDMEEQSPKEFS